MIKPLISFFCGIVFAIGLALAGMTQPSVIIDFLNPLGNWNPSLLFVLGGASGTYMIFFPIITRRKTPLFERRFFIPENGKVDKKLIIGSILFGLGWGLSGICPGPAFSSLVTFEPYILYFSAAMVGGMLFAGYFFDNKAEV